jgi:hypothetical protein
MKPASDVIVLKCTDGLREVSGRCIGKLFAVHHSVAFSPGTFHKDWTLTHVPSSFAVYKHFKVRLRAEKLAADLLAKTPASFWRFTTERGWKRKCRAMPKARTTAARLRNEAAGLQP